VELVQEKLYLITNPGIFILEKHTDVYYFTFEFEHIIENQMGNYHKGLSSDMGLGIMEEREDVLSFLIKNIGETIEKISYGYDNVCFDTKINV
jgi:hypothetical protein